MKNLRLWVLIVRGTNTTPQKADDGKDEMKPEHEKKKRLYRSNIYMYIII